MRLSLASATYAALLLIYRSSVLISAIFVLLQIRSTTTVPAGLSKEEMEAKAELKVDSAIQLLFGFLNSSHLEVSAATFEFASQYLGHIKQFNITSQKTTDQLKVLLVVLSAKMRQLEGVKSSQDNAVRISRDNTPPPPNCNPFFFFKGGHRSVSQPSCNAVQVHWSSPSRAHWYVYRRARSDPHYSNKQIPLLQWRTCRNSSPWCS